MFRSRRLLAIAAVLASIAAWGVAPPALAAQSDTVVIELSFVTTDGEPPAGEVAVLDLKTGIEYRNDRVSLGAPIEVDASGGVASEIQIRRTDLMPAAVTCDGTAATATVRGLRVIITPGDDRVVCTVTLTNELPLTGSSPTLGLISIVLMGAGALTVGVSRSAAKS